MVYTQSADRAQHVIDMVLAAYCLYTGKLLTFDPIPVFQNRAQTINKVEKQLLAGGGHSIAVNDLPVSCLIATKASQKNVYQYAIFKNLLSSRHFLPSSILPRVGGSNPPPLFCLWHNKKRIVMQERPLDNTILSCYAANRVQPVLVLSQR